MTSKAFQKLAFPTLAVLGVSLSLLLLASAAFALQVQSSEESVVSNARETYSSQPIALDFKQAETETRSGRLVGKAKILDNGDVVFRVTPGAGVFRAKGAEFDVLLRPTTAIQFFADLTDESGKNLTLKKAVKRLNENPTLLSFTGTFDKNTNTFRASLSLEIVA